MAQAREHPAVKPGLAACLALSLLASHAGAASPFGRMPLPTLEEPTTDDAVVRGVEATRAQCDALGPAAVWAQPPGDAGECLRYWHAGLQPGTNPRVLVFFAGDLLVGATVYKGYAGQTLAAVQKSVDAASSRQGVPYMFIGRPGTYGSSGEHKQRRREREAKLVSAALDEVAKRHGIEAFAVAGLSGGGHVVASLLGDRSDIVCAVAGGAVSAPKLRTRLRGWTIDSTGYGDSWEPLEHLDRARMHPALRVYVVGDPADSNVPWAAQTVLADRFQALGVPTEVLQAEGTGPERHGVAGSAVLVGAMCLKNQTNEEIRQRAARGLKG